MIERIGELVRWWRGGTTSVHRGRVMILNDAACRSFCGWSFFDGSWSRVAQAVARALRTWIFQVPLG